MTRRHRHEFTALSWHLGPYGRQDVHIHSCFEDGCDAVIVGEERECSGWPTGHHRRRLGQRWSDRGNEGTSLSADLRASKLECAPVTGGDAGG